MKNRLRFFLTLFLAAVFVVSGSLFVRQLFDYRAGDAAYAQAAAIAKLPAPASEPQEIPEPSAVPSEAAAPAAESAQPTADAPAPIDLPALQAVNADVLGWLTIPDTAISYPLVQGTDNDYYLTHTWNRSRSAVGAIFLDAACPANRSGFNTIIYGHRMNNGSMFASLKYYSAQSYWQSHSRIELTDADGTHTYTVYAAYEVSTEGEAYRLSFSDDAEKQAFLSDGISRSVITTGVTPAVRDRVLTLSTCTGRGHATRWVVQAVETA